MYLYAFINKQINYFYSLFRCKKSEGIVLSILMYFDLHIRLIIIDASILCQCLNGKF